MVNGLPGRMAAATASAVISRGHTLLSQSLTGPSIQDDTCDVDDQKVDLVTPSMHLQTLEQLAHQYPNLVVVDYTHPNAVNGNVQMYTQIGLSFVVGTTGGNVHEMKQLVEKHKDVYAVVAPNMGKQIVAFQAMMKLMAEQFPGAFKGYRMKVVESHQSGKADTSGTAKSVVSSFQKLGLDFDVEHIQKLRNKDDSMQILSVPEEFIEAGHAFHTYRLESGDGSVAFEFQHNVCGRSTYAQGTVDAVEFISRQRQEQSSKRMFDMIDILQSGQMS